LPSAAPVVLTSDRSFKALGIVGLLRITASPEVALKSDCTFTSAPVAIPDSFVFSASVKALVSEFAS